MEGNLLWTVYLALLATVTIGFLIKGKYKTFLEKIDFFISIFTWIGLFGYVTDTQILTPAVWKAVFIGALIWDISFTVFFNKLYQEETEGIPVHVQKMISAISLVILIGPMYYGLFHYAF
ncbi:hypothetical protein [Bacillus sp. V5-8f]|uniref:hypothetical protein n=1 Tax=Bacillus sp. V5-8f TaxID=2053044 RepID=UPI000C783644|nr:hypothetical protein [Bacillus sp. V5-8f]PLT35922.1 hypothetical protein CUU64_01210 [Bacillus sp. V5-8f]